ncbi:glutaredoxin family protein [Caloranaerobacter sp. DY30410]|uniref:glutaredoxin family protein n=1 Tax=Caloranaerobacter sp. DY30410 TaxID=3238305 RepID=UPI003D04A297
MDCQKAKSFFATHNIKVKIKSIEDPQVQEEMKKKFNRIMTPTILINGKTIIGFEDNKELIKKLLKIS